MKVPNSKALACSQHAPKKFQVPSSQGAVLLEVVLALVLIASAAAVIGAGLSASIDRVERLKLNAHAADLAVSVMSELQMGSKVLSEEEGPEPFEAPFENWTWEVQAEMTDEKVRDTGRTKKVEVIIRHEDPPAVYRLAQVIRLAEKEEDVLLEFGF
jgi:type II secretory pathway pseudopilin PulG